MSDLAVSAGFAGRDARARSLLAKRVFDCVGAVCLGVLALPLIICLALPSWLSGQSAFFGHRRIGRDGRPFTCWKLRSMCLDNQEVLMAHLRETPEAAREWAACHKLRDDPRVTRFGRILRRTSLDELPQLWNVLRGDMSLVGPRPITEGEIWRFADSPDVYFSLRPGLTGLWQVANRRGAGHSARLALDRQYAATRSFAGDLRILRQTLRVLLRPSGY